MAPAHKSEIEVRIAADGQVEILVTGQPGPSCTDVVAAFEALGPVVAEERTAEYYDVPAGAAVETRRGR